MQQLMDLRLNMLLVSHVVYLFVLLQITGRVVTRDISVHKETPSTSHIQNSRNGYLRLKGLVKYPKDSESSPQNLLKPSTPKLVYQVCNHTERRQFFTGFFPVIKFFGLQWYQSKLKLRISALSQHICYSARLFSPTGPQNYPI